MKLFKKYSYSTDLNNYKLNEHLDNFINYKEFSRINKKLNQAFYKVNKIIEKKFFYKNYNYIEPNFQYFQTSRVVANLFHKLLILNDVNKDNQTKIIELDVYKEEINFFDKTGVNGFVLERFANLYAMLGTYIGKPFKLSILGTFYKKKTIKYQQNTKSKNSLLKIINYDLSTLIFYFLNKCNFTKFNKKIFTLKYNPLIKEILPELFNKRIGEINIRNEISKAYYNFNLSKKDETEIKKINKILFNILEKNTITLKRDFNLNSRFFIGYLRLLADIASRNIYFLHQIKGKLRQKVLDLKNNNSDISPVCLTNGLFGSFGVACADALIENNFKIIGCQHGNKGMHLNELYELNFSEIKTSHIVFTYNESAKLTLSKKKNSKQQIKNIGAPRHIKLVKFKQIQKLINQLRFKTFTPTIYYVSHNIELNVGKYFPNTKNNIDLFSDELKIIEILGKINKNSIFKSYPTKQYLIDNKKYLEKKIHKFKNIKYLKDEEDFRYSRSVADIIITQSAQSTLGYCIGANVPLVYLNSNYYNSLVNKNTKKVFEKCFFVFDYDKSGWEQKLINFLNKPYHEIMKLWIQKEKYRKKYSDYHFLSETKHPGKLGARYIGKILNKKNL